MYTMQLHDMQFNRAHTRSVMAHFGQRCTIDTISEAERMLHGIRHDNWHRAYCMYGGEPVVVWARTNEGIIRPIACNAQYETDTMSFVYPGASRLVVARVDAKSLPLTEGAVWASSVLTGEIATAILTVTTGIYAAWEIGENEPLLVACCAP
jgi:hypothetical protein